ncbi:MAG: UTP--glucose-1-phosphate uridylyltransferase, partial [Methylococcales bacterium]|nr:UTP--glucose-1-phosphate uridylyltransferase [Methylococcales bacterium]
VAAGIDTMIFVTGRNKMAIPDHFDKSYELETELQAKGKQETLDIIQNIIPSHVTCVFIRQSEALGLGHAVHCAKPIVGNEPFAVILADDLIEDAGRGCIAQMVNLYHEKQCSILGVEQVNPSETDKYGVVKTGEYINSSAKIELIVEKPKPEVAPSNHAVVGRYILTPAIFEKIEQTGKGAGGEIQLTDAIADLLNDETVLAYEFEGKRYDCGSKLGFLIATVEHGLLHNDLRDDFLEYLKELAKRY